MAAETETFVGASGELHDGTGFDLAWTKPGTDPANALLDAWDDGTVEGLGASADTGAGDTYYLAPTAQGTDAMAYGRFRDFAEAKQTPLCAKLQDADNYAAVDVAGTGSIGTRIEVVESGVVDDGDVRWQGANDQWVKIEVDASGNIEGFTGGTSGSPTWSSEGSHGSTAFGAETNQGLVCPSNCTTTFGSDLAKYYEITFDALGGGGTTGSITEGATAGETFSAKATAAASITEAASAGETMSATAAAAASLTAAVQAGDTEAGPAAALAAITAAADAGDTEAATAQAAAAITAGAAAGETWVAKVAALADITAGATADEVMTTGTQQALDGAISEGSTAAAAFAAAAATLGSLTAAATAAESITATVAAIASLSEGIQAGDTFTAGLADEGRIVVQSIAIVAAMSGSPGIEASMKGAPGVGTRLKGTPTIH